MILVDSNILMYAAGADHPNKAPSIRFLEKVAREQMDVALDAEVLQEILYRYRAIGRWPEGRQVYDAARLLFPVIYPITAEILDHAKSLLEDFPALDARDALHAAVAFRYEAEAICSYDRDFDAVEGLTRIQP